MTLPTIGLGSYMTLASVLFGIGLLGIVIKRNVISILMCLELLLNAVNINFVAISRFVLTDNAVAQAFALMVMVVAAAEVAVGLSLIIAVYRKKKTIQINDFDLLKG